jgi:hypothetical protein
MKLDEKIHLVQSIQKVKWIHSPLLDILPILSILIFTILTTLYIDNHLGSIHPVVLFLPLMLCIAWAVVGTVTYLTYDEPSCYRGRKII